MGMQALVVAYQAILEERFPGVFVCPDPDVHFDDDIVLGVFCLPDGPKLAYTRFVTEELDVILRAKRLPRATLLPHSVSVTREHYPHIWTMAQKRIPTRTVSWQLAGAKRVETFDRDSNIVSVSLGDRMKPIVEVLRSKFSAANSNRIRVGSEDREHGGVLTVRMGVA